MRDALWLVAARRTETVVSASTPALSGVRVRTPVVKLALLVECSKPWLTGRVKLTAPGRPAPLTRKDCAVEAVKSAVLIAESEEALTLSVGATTAPLTATARDTLAGLGKPVEADTVTLPERATAADEAAKRTAMIWLRLPLCGTRLRALAAKLTPSVESSKPAGTLTLTLPGNPPPLTVKLCDAEAMPTRADIAGNVLVLTESNGLTEKDVVTSPAGL